jgi:bifunctional non-homologous end joining protein LigD
VPLESRREVLGEIFKDRGKAGPIGLSETMDASPAELVRVAKEFGFEGIVAKRKDSYYESGKRSGAWVKYKINKAQEFVIGGYTPDNPFDALIVGYYEGNNLLCCEGAKRLCAARPPRGLPEVQGLGDGYLPIQ